MCCGSRDPGDGRRTVGGGVSRPSIYDITPKMGRELKSLALKPDADIDLSDIPETIVWDHAVIGKFYRPIKRPVSIRIDADVLAWFRAVAESTSRP
jgi:hypothetical protein